MTNQTKAQLHLNTANARCLIARSAPEAVHSLYCSLSAFTVSGEFDVREFRLYRDGSIRLTFDDDSALRCTLDGATVYVPTESDDDDI